MSDGDGSEEAVRVFVRIRPLNKRELAEKQTIGWNFNETSMLEDTPNGTRVYAFDHCFSTTSTNQETYDIVGKPVVLKAMEGYNGTVFTCKLCSFVVTAMCRLTVSAVVSLSADGQTGSVSGMYQGLARECHASLMYELF